MNPVDQFLAVCAQAAQKLGLKVVVVAVRDPADGAARIVEAPVGALADLRDAFAIKLGFSDESETGWG